MVKDRLLPHLEMQNQVALDFCSSGPQVNLVKLQLGIGFDNLQGEGIAACPRIGT